MRLEGRLVTKTKEYVEVQQPFMGYIYRIKEKSSDIKVADVIRFPDGSICMGEISPEQERMYL